MLLDMIGRQQAIAIDEQEVRRGAVSRPFIAAAGRVKLRMRMRHEPHAERRLAGKIGDDPRRFIDRAVVRNDDLQPPRRPLSRDRL